MHTISRSAMLSGHACGRKRFLQYEALRGQPVLNPQTQDLIPDHIGGLTPLSTPVALLTGAAIHEGFAHLLNTLKSWEAIAPLLPWNELRRAPAWHDEIDHAAHTALDYFETKAATEGVSFGIDAPAQEFYHAEQRALIEGLVWVAGLRLVPEMVDRYKILEVEQEARLELAPGLRPFASRADALLEDRRTQELSVFSLKTSATYGRREEMGFKRDVQGLSEAIAIEKRLKHARTFTPLPPGSGNVLAAQIPTPKISTVQMAILLKGYRRAQGEDLGKRKEHYSPLTRAYCLKDPINGIEQWCWSYDTPKTSKDGGSYIGKLGKDWKLARPWERQGGLKQWVLDLDAGLIQPEMGDALAQCMALPEPWSRAEDEMEDWLEQAREEESRIDEYATAVNDALLSGEPQFARQLLNKYFPQNRRACVDYATMCPFDGRVCFTSEGLVQLSQGIVPEGLRPRLDHHAEEGEED